jgi:hypothetical protein
MEFWLSGSLSHDLFFFSRWNSGYQSLSHELFFFHDGILAIRKPFSRTFPFSRWNSSYQEALLMNFSFFTMEFWLSGSPSHELFFFHDGILALRKPFSRTFLFSRWNFGYQEALLMNFSFFTMEFWLSKPFSRTFLFSRWNSGYQEALTNFSFFTMEFWLS